MIHSNGINLFELVRTFDNKNVTDEKNLVPKLTFNNMNISIDGKYSKL